MPWFTCTTKSPGASSTKLSMAALGRARHRPRDAALAAEDLALLDGHQLRLGQGEARGDARRAGWRRRGPSGCGAGARPARRRPRRCRSCSRWRWRLSISSRRKVKLPKNERASSQGIERTSRPPGRAAAASGSPPAAAPRRRGRRSPAAAAAASAPGVSAPAPAGRARGVPCAGRRHSPPADRRRAGTRSRPARGSRAASAPRGSTAGRTISTPSRSGSAAIASTSSVTSASANPWERRPAFNVASRSGAEHDFARGRDVDPGDAARGGLVEGVEPPDVTDHVEVEGDAHRPVVARARTRRAPRRGPRTRPGC